MSAEPADYEPLAFADAEELNRFILEMIETEQRALGLIAGPLAVDQHELDKVDSTLEFFRLLHHRWRTQLEKDRAAKERSPELLLLEQVMRELAKVWNRR